VADLIDASETALWARDSPALDWLHGRGFRDEILRAARIGYHNQDRFYERGSWGLDRPEERLWLPRGIVIPWIVDGVVWKIFVRRPIPPDAWEAVRKPPPDAAPQQGIAARVLSRLREWNTFVSVGRIARACGLSEHDVRLILTELAAAKLGKRPTKHVQLAGSKNAIYNIDRVATDKPVMLVEAALDALAIQQEAGDLVVPIATGTTGGRVLAWQMRVAVAPGIMLSYDQDRGGDTPTMYWRSIFPDALIWRPFYDDPAAMLESGDDLRGWVQMGVESSH
jgi:hypothetical protein